MRAVLASALLTRLEEMTDTQNDPHLSTAEKYRILTSAVAKTWDLILLNSPGDAYVTSVTFSTVPGQKEYSLSTIVPAGDFYKVSQVYVDEGNGQLRPIGRINPMEEQPYRAPAAAIPMKLYYTPCAPTFVTGAESFDGINGWEEHTLQLAAMTVKKKKEDDYRPFESAMRDVEQRIQTMGNRSRAEPPRVVMKRRQRLMDRYAAWTNNVSCWDLRGSNLELMYRYGWSL